MGERLLCKQEVIGSIPFTSTIIWWLRAAKRGRQIADESSGNESCYEVWKILRYLVLRDRIRDV